MKSRLGVVLVLAALLVAVPTALAGSTKARSNSTTFNDSIGEDPNAPDITSVVVSNDDAGMITIQINISNRPALTPDMLVQIFLDTDHNPATGEPGVGTDFAIQLQPGAVGLFQWNGSAYSFAASQTSLTFAYTATGATIHISAADLGKTKAFGFAVVAISGLVVDPTGNIDDTNAKVDVAPDPGHGLYSYSVLTKLVLTVTAFTTSPKPPRAGRPYSVTLAASENDTGGPVQSGTVICTATLAGKRVIAVTHAVANGVATCVWRIPKTAKGKTMRGTITLVVQGTRVTRPFAALFR